MGDAPLAGLRVLEFSMIYAGPWAGMHLADLGADVLKVEPPDGDPIRDYAAVVPENSKRFSYLNRGKRAIGLDLREPRARDIVYRLMPNIDIVLSNYRPGSTTSLGIDYETLARHRADVIYADISAWDHDGPHAGRGGTDASAMAYSGATVAIGLTDARGAPMTPPIAVADMSTGIAAVAAVLAAVVHRDRTGEGQLVRLSLLRSVLAFTGWMSMRDPVSDPVLRDPVVDRLGELRERGAPYNEMLAARGAPTAHGIFYGGYLASDGALTIGAVSKATRDAVRRVFGIEHEPSDSPDYDAADPANAAEAERFYQLVRERMRTRTVADWIAAFEAAGVPAAPVQFPEEVADDPQVAPMMVDVAHPLLGIQRQIGPMFDMSKTPPAVAGASPLLGQHTDEVLNACGYSPADIELLRTERVVF